MNAGKSFCKMFSVRPQILSSVKKFLRLLHRGGVPAWEPPENPKVHSLSTHWEPPENPWEPMRTHWEPMRTHENPLRTPWEPNRSFLLRTRGRPPSEKSHSLLMLYMHAHCVLQLYTVLCCTVRYCTVLWVSTAVFFQDWIFSWIFSWNHLDSGKV